MRTLGLIVSILFLGLVSCSDRYKRYFPPKPTIDNRIFDNAHLFTTSQKDSIFELIKQLDDSIGSQVAVLTIETLNGQEIEKFSINKADSLKLGRYSYKDGLLFTFSVREKMMRMEVGIGLEKVIPDEVAKRINQDIIVPKFRMEKYGQGVYDGVNTVKKLIESKKGLVGVFHKD